MPADVMESWLRDGRHARIGRILLRPLENTLISGMPMSIQRGQAEAFMLIAQDQSRWILKKFHKGRGLDVAYLSAVSALLPRTDGFVAGTGRQILRAADLSNEAGCHYSQVFAQWLDGAVLMPWIMGLDWAGVADEIRHGNLTLDRAHRLLLCRNLAELVRALEATGGSHRDIAAGNMLVNLVDCAIFLIDFDSLYHPTLQMPPGTTCGTVGYAPPFGWQDGYLDPVATWCPHADRFALTILCVEFLVIEKNAPMTAEGGMFDQDDFRRRSGQSISYAMDRLQIGFPQAGPLFESAIRSNSFGDCPTPDAWITLSMAGGAAVHRPPKLDDLELIGANWFQRHLAKRWPAAPIWPAPQLAEVLPVIFETPRVPAVAVSIPDDPWAPWHEETRP